MNEAVRVVSAHFEAFQKRDVAAAVAPFSADALVFDDTATVHQGKEAIAAFFDTLFSLLPVGSTQIKRFEHKVHDNAVLLWWAADSSEATFEMHAVFVVNKGSIVTHSMGGVRKIKNRADRTSK